MDCLSMDPEQILLRMPESIIPYEIAEYSKYGSRKFWGTEFRVFNILESAHFES